MAREDGPAMTLAMPDSIRVADLPDGYPAYLGYADGNWPTSADLAKRFPAAHRVILTVTGNTLNCDGIDCEPGNPDAKTSAEWTAQRLAVMPASRPVIYASVIGIPGYGMRDVLRELDGRGIPRSAVRLLTAHYEWQTSGASLANKHICGPATCGLLPVTADGTQWTDVWPGAAEVVDLSSLRDDFFGTQEVHMQFPGIPGTWITATQFIDSQGTEWVIGLGTNGLVYRTKRPAGGTWSGTQVVA